MTYEEAKRRVRFALKNKLKIEKMQKKAQKALKNFKGRKVSGISKENYFKKLKKYNLDQYEANNFIFRLMDSTDKKGYFTIDKKIIAYRILSQKLPKNINKPIKLNSLNQLKNITKNDDTLLDIKKHIDTKFYFRLF